MAWGSVQKRTLPETPDARRQPEGVHQRFQAQLLFSTFYSHLFHLTRQLMPELSRIVKSMAEIKTKQKNLLANQCLSRTFYIARIVGHFRCRNAIMKAADVAHTPQAIHMTKLYRWVAMVFIFSVCPHHVHACMQKRCAQRDRCKVSR